MMRRQVLSSRRRHFSSSTAFDRSRVETQAQQWIEWDPNAETRAVVDTALRQGDFDDLAQRLGTRLQFGTAGLRGPFGAGYNRMNDLVVLQTAQGLCRYLQDQFPRELRSKGVAIGFDHRAAGTLNSENFALMSAAVLMSQDVPVYLFDRFVATPLVPFCVENFGCAAGVMVTASHNPREDDGYKVYWENGAQIISPHDSGIAGAIDECLAPWEAYDLQAVRGSSLCRNPTEEVVDKYFAAMKQRLCRHADENATSEVPLTYTAMHGVGHCFSSRAFEAFGLPPYVEVEQQLHPDPAFPTVKFPNPEEGKGALALAFAAADAAGSRLVLANDPDADRLAVAEKSAGGDWRVFTGNEIGVLLGHWQWQQYQRGRGGDGSSGSSNKDGPGAAILASTVSSKMLQAVAEAEGFLFEETLTGFKWMGNRSQELRDEGYDVIFAFEEAIGFCLGDLVKDKDGVCAAAVFAEMANSLGREGLTVADHLDHLAEKYGYFLNRNHYVKCYDPAVVAAIFERIRNGGKYQEFCGPYRIAGVRDLTTGFDSSTHDQRTKLPASASSEMITFTFENGSVVTLRTSGTEPKLKYYVELRTEDPQTAQQELESMVECVISDFLQPDKNPLEFPTDD